MKGIIFEIERINVKRNGEIIEVTNNKQLIEKFIEKAVKENFNDIVLKLEKIIKEINLPVNQIKKQMNFIKNINEDRPENNDIQEKIIIEATIDEDENKIKYQAWYILSLTKKGYATEEGGKYEKNMGIFVSTTGTIDLEPYKLYYLQIKELMKLKAQQLLADIPKVY
jgi:predicted transport protein